MNKYDVALDLETNNSLSIIADNIRPNSMILEFGPATGRLTKYLKEQLNCQIYIVEIDEEAYQEALKYAIDGSCGDIELYQWEKKINPLQFDYIIFADVLEHLKNPDKVVKTVKKYLQDDGVLIVSAPNIAHDSIIVNLLEDVFQYNKIGLLDETHIHFFTYHSLKLLFESNSYSIIREEATYLKDDIGEFPFSLNKISEDQKEVLANHKYGHVYQFVFFAMKAEEYAKKTESFDLIQNVKVKKKYEIFELYINSGSGFSENEKISVEIDKEYNKINFGLEEFEKIRELRLDFSRSGNCIVALESIIIDGTPIDTKNLSGNFLFANGGKYYFEKEDPYLFVELSNIKNIEIIFNLKKLPQSGWRLIKEFNLINEYMSLIDKCGEIQSALDDLQNQLKVKTDQYNIIANSKFWKMTKPLRKIIALIKK